MNWPVLALLILCLILALWINSLYAREWLFFKAQDKIAKEIEKRGDIMKEALMIFTVAKQITNFNEDSVHYSMVNTHLTIAEVVFENYWVKFYFDWRWKTLRVEDLSEIERGRQSSIKLRIKNCRFESNKLAAFFGIPGPITSKKLEKLMDVALKRRDNILANHTKEELLTEVVFPFLVNKCNLESKEDAMVMLSFLATILEEDKNEKEEQ